MQEFHTGANIALLINIRLALKSQIQDINLVILIFQKNKDLFGRICSTLELNGVEYRTGTAGGGNQARQPYLEKYDYKVFGELDVADHIHDYGLYVGNHTDLNKDQIINLCEALNGC